jgi:signal transduction histidine kinase
MNTQEWINLIACVGELAVAVLIPLTASGGPLALPLILISVDFFAWNFAQLASHHSGNAAWHLLDMVASPLGIALAFHFLARFMGRSRQLRWTLRMIYAYYGVLAVTSACGWFSPTARRLAFSSLWSWAWLGGMLPLAAVAVTWLMGHIRRAGSREERNRAWMLLVSVAIISPLSSTELLADLGYTVVRLGSVGILTFNSLLVIAALRFRLFDRALTPSAILWATVLSAIGGIAYLTVFHAAGTNTALLVLGTLTVTLLILAAARLVMGAMMARRDQTVRLVTLGRLAAQMGHDLKNPLAALKGAAQFLREERSQGRSIDDKIEFLELMTDQIDRLKGAVEKYERLGRVQAMCLPLQLNEMIRDMVALQRFANGSGVAVKAELAPDLPVCRADRDLVAGALENLLQNAFEATPRNATVVVRTAPAAMRQTRGVAISVEDSGVGMSARVRERAMDDFFTTKETGSGLGLAFVRRVAEAHGGEVALSSKEGVGTTVRLFLPLEVR